jgi:hypothetical protein
VEHGGRGSYGAWPALRLGLGGGGRRRGPDSSAQARLGAGGGRQAARGAVVGMAARGLREATRSRWWRASDMVGGDGLHTRPVAVDGAGDGGWWRRPVDQTEGRRRPKLLVRLCVWATEREERGEKEGAAGF